MYFISQFENVSFTITTSMPLCITHCHLGTFVRLWKYPFAFKLLKYHRIKYTSINYF